MKPQLKAAATYIVQRASCYQWDVAFGKKDNPSIPARWHAWLQFIQFSPIPPSLFCRSA